MNVKNLFNNIAAILFCSLTFVPASANICNRTPEIQNVIIETLKWMIGEKLDCHKVGAQELAKIKQIVLSNVKLETLRPEDLLGLSSLEYLTLRTRLTSFPENIEKLTSLKKLNLSKNSLQGPIPESLGQLENLEELDLHSNQLSGPLPKTLGDLKNLRKLELHQNMLSGPLPESLGQLEKLEILYLHSNHFSGPLPQRLGGLKSLGWLDLHGNEFSGPLPESVRELKNLGWIYLDNTQLIAPWPFVLGELENLEYFYIYKKPKRPAGSFLKHAASQCQ